jgi:salicylate hydroxylase
LTAPTGLHSIVRTSVLGTELKPAETGDLAYRATITKTHIDSLSNDELVKLLRPDQQKVWWGPDRHAVLYPVRAGEIFNLVLAHVLLQSNIQRSMLTFRSVPDDLPPEVSKVPADIEQMRKLFEGWDPMHACRSLCITSRLTRR